MIRLIRRAIIRRQIKKKLSQFAAEPMIKLIALSAKYSNATEQKLLASYVADGVKGAIQDLGFDGPWAADRRNLAEAAIRKLLAAAFPPEFTALVFQKLDNEASA